MSTCVGGRLRAHPPGPPALAESVRLALLEQMLGTRFFDPDRHWAITRCYEVSPPPSEPAKSAFLRLSAIGRMVRSTRLESMSSSRKRVRPDQRVRRSHLPHRVQSSPSISAASCDGV